MADADIAAARLRGFWCVRSSLADDAVAWQRQRLAERAGAQAWTAAARAWRVGGGVFGLQKFGVLPCVAGER